MILKVALYLVSKKDEGATVHNIISSKANIGLNVQDQTRFTNEMMIPMEKDGWVKKTKYSERFHIYVITEKGKSAVSDVLELRNGKSLLSTLEAFRDLIQ